MEDTLPAGSPASPGEGLSSPGGGLVIAVIFSVLALEVLNWLKHVNLRPIISSPSYNSASSSFGECTGGNCARLSLRHVCTHAHRHTGAMRTRPRLHSRKQTSPWASQQILISWWGPFPFQAFSCYFVLHRTPSDEEGINSCSVPLLGGVWSWLCYANLAEKLEQWSLTSYETFHLAEIAGPGWGE